MAAELLTGDFAPDFRAVAVGPGHPPGGAEILLSSLRGNRVALCFYPQNDPLGVNEQGCAIRNAWERFNGKIALFGISNETAAGHQRLIDQLALPFPLLSDADHAVARAYGLWLGDGGGGDAEGGESTVRTSFVIGAHGRIDAIVREARPAEHVQLLLATLDA